MLTELHGKGGRSCEPAREGKLHCPLIVRPTSEDVVTGHLASAFEVLNPRWWLSDFLNEALGAERFRRQVHRRFRVEPWRNRPPYPRELLPWTEGSSQVDLTLSWENPPTTVFIEAKYNSNLASKTSADDGTSGFPSDQLIRNVRVGLLECGWFSKDAMFVRQPRDFVLILLAPVAGNFLVKQYRDPRRLSQAIPHATKLVGMPRTPFIGEIGYGSLVSILRRQRRMFSRPERVLIDQLTSYLEHKRNNFSAGRRERQLRISDSARSAGEGDTSP